MFYKSIILKISLSTNNILSQQIHTETLSQMKQPPSKRIHTRYWHYQESIKAKTVDETITVCIEKYTIRILRRK